MAKIRISVFPWPILLFYLFIAPAHGQNRQSQGQGSDRAQQEKIIREAASRSLNSLGVFYYEDRQYAKAIRILEDALKYDSTSENIRINLAMVYLQQGEFEKIIETLDSSFKISQPDQRSLTALAVANFALGNYDQAIPYYEKLVERDPKDLLLRLKLAGAYKLSGNEAEKEKLLKQLPNDELTRAQYHIILADAHRSRTRVLEAVAEYEKALSLAPKLSGVNFWLGVLYSDLHSYVKAAEAFRRELQINPQSADASYSLGAYFLSYGADVDQAQYYFQKTLQLSPNHSGGYLGLIQVQLILGKPAEALEWAQRAEENGATGEEFHYLKSRALNLLGKRQLAEKELKIFEEIKNSQKNIR
jgi:tetratricopeptide (TPR) repeat protein